MMLMLKFMLMTIINNEQLRFKIQIILNGIKHSNCKRKKKKKLNYISLFLFLFISRLGKKDKHIHIKVYDCDGPLDRDSIGSAKIDLEPARQRGSFDEWVKLPTLLGLKSNGEVNIRLNFQPA